MKNNLQNKITITLVGRSGSGKGTLAKFIMEKLGSSAHPVETGKMLRVIIEKKNPTAEIIADILKQGHLTPSWLAAFLWIDEFVNKGIANKHLVFDGSPRTISEAKIMDEVMEFHTRPLPLCIYVDASEEVVTKRLLMRGRADDTLAVIKNRMNYFPKFVLPVIEYYKSHSRLIHCDGNPSPEEVWKEADHALKKKLRGVWQ